MSTMSRSQGSSTSSFETYTFDLRNGLRQAARLGLSQLEEMITEVGYDWLEGYMESITAESSSRAPIADLIKTPSRTQTVRKTRAATATAKARSKKAVQANSKLAESTSAPSPLAAASPRRALSPLVLNTPPVKSPNLSAKGASKAGKATKEKKAEGKTTKGKGVEKGKRGRPKKVVQPTEEQPMDDLHMEPPSAHESEFDQTIFNRNGDEDPAGTHVPNEIDVDAKDHEVDVDEEPVESPVKSKSSQKSTKSKASSKSSKSSKSTKPAKKDRHDEPAGKDEEAVEPMEDVVMDVTSPVKSKSSHEPAESEKASQRSAKATEELEIDADVDDGRLLDNASGGKDDVDHAEAVTVDEAAEPPIEDAAQESGQENAAEDEEAGEEAPSEPAPAEDRNDEAETGQDGDAEQDADRLLAETTTDITEASNNEADLDLELPSEVPAPTPPADNNPLPFAFPDFAAQTSTATRPQPDPAVPVRQVRSSWLSKALGTGTVPITAGGSSHNDVSAVRRSILDNNMVRKSVMPSESMRKSVVQPEIAKKPVQPQQRVSTLPDAPVGFGAASRKSLGQPTQSGVKRKSEEPVAVEKGDHDSHRPEKMPRAETRIEAPTAKEAPTTSARQHLRHSVFSPNEEQPRRITPFGRPKESTSGMTVHFPLSTTTPAPSSGTSRPIPNPETSERYRTDIFKVTKALDDLRERTAEKEASKAKAQAQALAMSGGTSKPSAESRSTSAQSGGFFRGLGSLGRSLGLGGTAKSAEDEAMKLQRELEEDRRAEKEAEMELKRLMDEAVAEGTVVVAADNSDDDSGSEAATEKASDERDREASETITLPPTKEEVFDPAMEGDEVADNKDARTEVKPKVRSPPPPPPREATPPRSIMATITASTTPLVSPPKKLMTLPRAPLQPATASHSATNRATSSPPAKSSSKRAPESPRSPRSPRNAKVAKAATSPRSPTSPRPVSRLAQSAVPPRPPKSPERSKKVQQPLSPRIQSPRLAKTNANALRSAAASPVPSKQKAIPKPAAPQTQSRAEPPVDSNDEMEDETDLPELPQPEEQESDQTDVEMDEEPEPPRRDQDMPAAKMFKGDSVDESEGAKMSKSASAQSIAPSLATSTTSSSDMLNRASTIAGKTLGFKPTTGPVKSLALAAQAAKKEQATNDRKAQIREQLEQRKAQAAQRKAEEERLKAEEDRKIRAAELEEKRKHRLALEKQRKEREEKAAAVAREKAARKEEEAAAAAKIKAEQEANRKRKLLQAGQKAAPVPVAKKPAVPGVSTSTSQNSQLAKSKPETMRIIKPAVAAAASTFTSNSNGIGLGPAQKMGPTHFRSISTNNPESHHATATATASSTQSSSTISLVQQGQAQIDRQALGPPSRPSTQQPHTAGTGASAVLQQSRIALKAQIEEKALEMQSEDIELPDIASEYSDSDDSDKDTDFVRPAWAESPELRAALQQQAYRDPDELFGPIKPVNMEELFKARAGKFRARSSSANWHATGDKLTRGEEIEYARRMGFKPIDKGARAGSSTGGAGTSAQGRSSQA